MKTLILFFSVIFSTRSFDIAHSIKKLDSVKLFYTEISKQTKVGELVDIIASKTDYPFKNSKMVQLYYLELSVLRSMSHVEDCKEYLYTFMDLYNKFVHWDMLDQVSSDMLRYIVNTNKMLCDIMPINSSIDSKGIYNSNYMLLQKIPILLEERDFYLSKIKSYLNNYQFGAALLNGRFDPKVKISNDLLLLIVNMTKASNAYFEILYKIGQDLLALDAAIDWDELQDNSEKRLKLYLRGSTTPKSIFSNIKLSLDAIFEYRRKRLTPECGVFAAYPKLHDGKIYCEAHLSYLYGKMLLFSKYLEFTTSNFDRIISRRRVSHKLQDAYIEIYMKCLLQLDSFGGLSFNFKGDVQQSVHDEKDRKHLENMTAEILSLLPQCQRMVLDLIDLVIKFRDPKIMNLKINNN